MRRSLHDILIGPPLPTQRSAEERLGNVRALAALSPDALASVAYANQEIFLGLAVAGAAGLAFSFPIGLAIAGLLAILTLSYTQTITAYPSGGGSYTVARENLGTNFGLVAAAALMTDYVLNVAVSVTAGVAAIAAAFPFLWPYRTVLALLLLVIITIANLRGVREAGAVMTLPVYLFVGVFLVMIIVGAIRAVLEGPGTFEAAAQPAVAFQPLTLVIVLRTFASGCTALTGVEAISNGVPLFRPPESRHANQTMLAMALLMAVLFLGTVGLAQYFAVTAGPEDTILSALARRIFGEGPAYLVVQASTLLVLAVAANTSFMGFPRVTSIMARDGYVPRQLALLGDRLVYSNGILLLAGVAGALVVIFQGDTHLLIPLFAVGAFLAFTLSQAGMVAHWVKERGPAWQVKAAINGLGVVATVTALGVIAVSKFVHGAWIVIVLIPLLVIGFHRVRRHYNAIAGQLRVPHPQHTVKPLPRPRVVVPVTRVHRGTLLALRYAASISDDVTALFIELEPGQSEVVRREWAEHQLEALAHLKVVQSPYRSVVGPLLDFLDAFDADRHDGQLATLVLPEFVTAHWWEELLHNQTAWVIKLALIYRRRRFGKDRPIIDIPLHLRE